MKCFCFQINLGWLKKTDETLENRELPPISIAKCEISSSSDRWRRSALESISSMIRSNRTASICVFASVDWLCYICMIVRKDAASIAWLLLAPIRPNIRRNIPFQARKWQNLTPVNGFVSNLTRKLFIHFSHLSFFIFKAIFILKNSTYIFKFYSILLRVKDWNEKETEFVDKIG